MHIAGVVLHNVMKIFSHFDHLFMACLVVLHVPATFAPARGKLTSPPIPPPHAFAGRGNTKREGGWMRWCMAPSHPLKYPLTHRIHSGIHSLTSGNCVTGGGVGGPACFEGGGCGSYHRWIKAMLFVVKWGTWW